MVLKNGLIPPKKSLLGARYGSRLQVSHGQESFAILLSPPGYLWVHSDGVAWRWTNSADWKQTVNQKFLIKYFWETRPCS